MKKITSLLLVFVLLIGCMFSLTACSDDGAPELPEGYKRFEKFELSFAYPEDWTKTGGIYTILMSTTDIGNNITVVSEKKNDIYENLTVESFDEKFRPSYEAMGLEISNLVISNGETNNVSYTMLCYDATMSGKEMKQTAIFTNIGWFTYSVTITEVVEDPTIVEMVLNTLYAKDVIPFI